MFYASGISILQKFYVQRRSCLTKFSISVLELLLISVSHLIIHLFQQCMTHLSFRFAHSFTCHILLSLVQMSDISLISKMHSLIYIYTYTNIHEKCTDMKNILKALLRTMLFLYNVHSYAYWTDNMHNELCTNDSHRMDRFHMLIFVYDSLLISSMTSEYNQSCYLNKTHAWTKHFRRIRISVMYFSVVWNMYPRPCFSRIDKYHSLACFVPSELGNRPLQSINQIHGPPLLSVFCFVLFCFVLNQGMDKQLHNFIKCHSTPMPNFDGSLSPGHTCTATCRRLPCD